MRRAEVERKERGEREILRRADVERKERGEHRDIEESRCRKKGERGAQSHKIG